MSLPKETLDAIAEIVVVMEGPGRHMNEALHRVLVSLCQNAYTAGRISGIEEMLEAAREQAEYRIRPIGGGPYF